MKYTDEVIRAAFDGYYKRTDAVFDYLKLWQCAYLTDKLLIFKQK